jgi:hypothetical protein
MALDEQQLTGAAATRVQQPVDGAQGLFSLEKPSRTDVSSDSWSALRQKTGEPP